MKNFRVMKKWIDHTRLPSKEEKPGHLKHTGLGNDDLIKHSTKAASGEPGYQDRSHVHHSGPANK